ncbi:MAG: hypothetical protein HQK55_02330 [Deltaproteobacteria bacterium]|nr:hypothetical protein [Deltaproteobacteria bacterium]
MRKKIVYGEVGMKIRFWLLSGICLWVVFVSTFWATESLANSYIYTYKFYWGSGGTANGQFNSPGAMALDGFGNVYVTDTGNDRIQKFSSDGKFLAAWGSNGTANGQFSAPRGIALDGSGNVYVTDTDNNRIQKFSSSGQFLLAWGSRGSSNGQFNGPYGIAVDVSGNVYVSEYYNARVQKFNNAGQFLLAWGSSGSGNGQFQNPTGMVVDGFGNVYVADWLAGFFGPENNGRIQKFTSTGQFLAVWDGSDPGKGLFSGPEYLAVDGSGNIYVTDENDNRVQKLDGNGQLLVTLPSSAGDLNLSSPEGIVVDISGNVYVTTEDKNKIAVFAFVPAATVSVTKNGSGTGKVTSSPGSIDCGSKCSDNFALNTVITLTANPNSGSTFAGWSGACVGNGTCSFTLTSDTNVAATFSTSSSGGGGGSEGGSSGSEGGGCFISTVLN